MKNHLTEDLIGVHRSSTKRLGRRYFALQSTIKIRFPRAAIGKDTPLLLLTATLREYPYQVSPMESREASSAHPRRISFARSIQDTILFFSICPLFLQCVSFHTIYIFIHRNCYFPQLETLRNVCDKVNEKSNQSKILF